MFITCFQFEIKLLTRLHAFSRVFRSSGHRAAYTYSLRVLIGSLEFLCLLWLVRESILILVLWHSKPLYLEFCTCTLLHETSAGMRNVAGSWKKKIYYCINFKRGSILQGIQKCNWQTQMTFMYKWRVLNLYVPGETLLRKHLVREWTTCKFQVLLHFFFLFLLPICLSACLPARLSLCLSVPLSLYLPVSMSVCLSVCLGTTWLAG